MENSDPHTSHYNNGSAADNDGHIFGEELAHKKEDNGEIVSKLKELFGGETVTAFEGKLSIYFVVSCRSNVQYALFFMIKHLKFQSSFCLI